MSLIVAFLFLLTAQDPPRKPVPEEADRKAALKVIQEVFEKGYREKGPAARRSLAARLLEQAAQSTDDATSCYVLLRESLAIATEAGDAQVAVRAADELARLYSVDGLPLKLTALNAIGKATKSPEDVAACAQQLLALGESAFKDSNFETAEKALTSASAFAKSAKNIALVSKAESKLREVAGLRARAKVAQDAQEVLAKNPGDPTANATLGAYLCLIQERWEAGLPYLAKGSDDAFKAAAQLDLSMPLEAAKRAALGDAWWDAGQKESGRTGDACRRRASHWYLKALPELSGLTRVRAERRLLEAGKDVDSAGRAIVIEALIDGDTELHVTPTSIYWKNLGVSKVGRHHGRNEATYVNGKPWMPAWKFPNDERGPDQTDAYVVFAGPVENLRFELTAIAPARGTPGIEKRDRIVSRVENGEFIVLVPDTQSDSRWYTLTLRAK